MDIRLEKTQNERYDTGYSKKEIEYAKNCTAVTKGRR